MTAAWNRFWFEQGSTRSLCLLRIALGLTFVLRCTMKGGLQNPLGIRFLLPRREFSSPESFFLEGFRLPAPGFAWLGAPTYEQFRWLEVLILGVTVLVVLGLFTRVVVPLLAALLSYTLLLSQLFYFHHYWTFISVFAILALSDCGQHYSLDALLFRRGLSRPDRPVAPIRMIQVLISMIYGFTFLAKCNEGWFTGRIFEVFQADGSIDSFWGPIVLAFVSFRFLAMFTLTSDVILCIGFWIPGLRWVALAFGILLHTGIDLLMDVRTYSLEMFAIYIVCMMSFQGGAENVGGSGQGNRGQAAEEIRGRQVALEDLG